MSDDKLCGVKYKGRVLDGIKGISVGEPLEWYTAAYSNNYGLEIGISYILFLAKRERSDPFRPDTALYGDRAELHQVCGSLLQGKHIIHSGYGALKVSVHDSIKALDVERGEVSIPIFVIALPGTLERIEERPEPLVYVRVQLKDILSFLKSLNP